MVARLTKYLLQQETPVYPTGAKPIGRQKTILHIIIILDETMNLPVCLACRGRRPIFLISAHPLPISLPIFSSLIISEREVTRIREVQAGQDFPSTLISFDLIIHTKTNTC